MYSIYLRCTNCRKLPYLLPLLGPCLYSISFSTNFFNLFALHFLAIMKTTFSSTVILPLAAFLSLAPLSSALENGAPFSNGSIFSFPYHYGGRGGRFHPTMPAKNTKTVTIIGTMTVRPTGACHHCQTVTTSMQSLNPTTSPGLEASHPSSNSSSSVTQTTVGGVAASTSIPIYSDSASVNASYPSTNSTTQTGPVATGTAVIPVGPIRSPMSAPYPYSFGNWTNTVWPTASGASTRLLGTAVTRSGNSSSIVFSNGTLSTSTGPASTPSAGFFTRMSSGYLPGTAPYWSYNTTKNSSSFNAIPTPSGHTPIVPGKTLASARYTNITSATKTGGDFATGPPPSGTGVLGTGVYGTGAHCTGASRSDSSSSSSDPSSSLDNVDFGSASGQNGANEAAPSSGSLSSSSDPSSSSDNVDSGSASGRNGANEAASSSDSSSGSGSSSSSSDSASSLSNSLSGSTSGQNGNSQAASGTDQLSSSDQSSSLANSISGSTSSQNGNNQAFSSSGQSSSQVVSVSGSVSGQDGTSQAASSPDPSISSDPSSISGDSASGSASGQAGSNEAASSSGASSSSDPSSSSSDPSSGLGTSVSGSISSHDGNDQAAPSSGSSSSSADPSSSSANVDSGSVSGQNGANGATSSSDPSPSSDSSSASGATGASSNTFSSGAVSDFKASCFVGLVAAACMFFI